MVDRVQRKGNTVYLCELCGYGYRSLEMAEECEEYCDTHESYSLDIHKHATFKPTVSVMSLAV
jgi:hypothetical protein